ncbi:MAG TPA: sigma-70 family RNA polymerase sigma factor [Chitinophagales bacterium]|nr:sigma-70 family RNA polymerase sigma factor [Chitinophagales bacterium]
MEHSEKLSEVEIIERILKGDKKLYEIIVRRFNPYLYKVGRAYNYNHEDTQDLMQDTFVDTYKNLAQFKGTAQFKTWIIRIMLNNCFKKSQKSSYKNEVMKDVNDQSKPLYSNDNNQTDHLVRNHELGRIIEEALSKIPHEYRMIFSLREINELNVAETAELLKITESNVKTRLSRANKMLREVIQKSYVPSELFDFNLVHCTPMVGKVLKEIDSF